MEVEMVELIKKEGNTVSFKLTISAEELNNAERQAYLKNKKDFVMPGFRKGHVPMKMIQNMYGKDIFFEEAINDILPAKYDSAVKELNLKPIDMPDMDFGEREPGKDLVMDVKVDVEPEVEIKDYKGIEVEDVKYEVTDELLDSLVENERAKNARLINVDDRPAKEGDKVNIDFEGFVDDVAFEGGKGENQELELGSKTFIEGFEEQIAGKNVGDEFDINVKFPEDYHAENLKGKDAVFKIKLNSIGYEELPELDDEFIKDISDFDTVEEFRKDLKAKKEKEFEDKAKVERENKVIEKLIEQVSDDVPEAMIDTVIDTEIDGYNRSLQMQGMSFEQYLQMLGTNLEDYKKERRPEALKTVKARLAVEAVKRMENIDVTEEEMKEEAKKTALKYGMKEDDDKMEEMVKFLLSQNPQGMKEDIASKKAVEFLVENAKFTEPKKAEKKAAKKASKKASDKEDKEEKEEEK